MTHISNLDDAAGKVLGIYHDFKSKRKDKKENLLEKAIRNVWEIWGRGAKYEFETFREIMFTKVNDFKAKKAQKDDSKKTKAKQKAKQLTLFANPSVHKTIRRVKKIPGYEALSFATH